MLYLQHDFCKTIFKITHKLYIASVSAHPPHPRKKILGAHLPQGIICGEPTKAVLHKTKLAPVAHSRHDVKESNNYQLDNSLQYSCSKCSDS
jgi:hypothetical protein